MCNLSHCKDYNNLCLMARILFHIQYNLYSYNHKVNTSKPDITNIGQSNWVQIPYSKVCIWYDRFCSNCSENQHTFGTSGSVGWLRRNLCKSKSRYRGCMYLSRICRCRRMSMTCTRLGTIHIVWMFAPDTTHSHKLRTAANPNNLSSYSPHSRMLPLSVELFAQPTTKQLKRTVYCDILSCSLFKYY